MSCLSHRWHLCWKRPVSACLPLAKIKTGGGSEEGKFLEPYPGGRRGVPVLPDLLHSYGGKSGIKQLIPRK